MNIVNVNYAEKYDFGNHLIYVNNIKNNYL